MTKGFFTKFKSKTKTSNRPARGLCMPGDQGQEGVSSRAGPARVWECGFRPAPTGGLGQNDEQYECLAPARGQGKGLGLVVCVHPFTPGGVRVSAME